MSPTAGRSLPVRPTVVFSSLPTLCRDVEPVRFPSRQRTANGELRTGSVYPGGDDRAVAFQKCRHPSLQCHP
jgi:hypothetical protein